MSDRAARFLGFAFASADLLFELDCEGRIAFAMGASQQAFGEDQAGLIGRPWRDLVPECDHELVTAFLLGLADADRRGPIRIGLKPRAGQRLTRHANLSACRLPQLGGTISCALSLSGVAASAAGAGGGLHDLEFLLSNAAGLLAEPPAGGLDVELVELPGLETARSRMNAADAQAVMDGVAAAIRAESIGGEAAAQLADERFALVRDASRPRQSLIDGLNRVADAHGGAFAVSAQSLDLPATADPALAMKALRYALHSFMESGAAGAKAGFERVLQETMAEARAFADMVRERRFKLAYQPIVCLRTGQLSHFEVLARFGDGSPHKTILMAEALDLIEDFDLAVADIAARQLRTSASRTLKLAINLSAQSLMRPGFLDRLWARLGPTKALEPRLKFELTETAAIHDLAAANALIQQIRKRGFHVCLDDFGAGQASLAYLQALTVDTVKIDGQYVRELTASGRDGAVVRHLVKLCGELGVNTIAEMVETQQIADDLRSLGVDCGQGWLFGKPTPAPEYRPPAPARRPRQGAAATG